MPKMQSMNRVLDVPGEGGVGSDGDDLEVVLTQAVRVD